MDTFFPATTTLAPPALGSALRDVGHCDSNPNDGAQVFRTSLHALVQYLEGSLFQANDSMELEIALDDLLDNPEYAERVRAVSRNVTFCMVQEAAAALQEQDVPPPRLLRLFSQSRELMELANETWRLSNAVMAVQLDLLAAANHSGRAQRRLPARTSEILSSAMPSYIKEFVLSGRMADAASWSLMAAACASDPDAASDPPPDWLTGSLLRTWNTMARRHLQVAQAADFPPPTRYQELVPMDPEINVAESIRNSQLREQKYQHDLAEARSSNAVVHPEGQELEDDD